MDDTITMDDKITQQIIDRLFKDNPNIFTIRTLHKGKWSPNANIIR